MNNNHTKIKHFLKLAILKITWFFTFIIKLYVQFFILSLKITFIGLAFLMMVLFASLAVSYFSGDKLIISKEDKFKSRREICELEKLALQTNNFDIFMKKADEINWEFIEPPYIYNDVKICKIYYGSVVVFRTPIEVFSLAKEWNLHVFFVDGEVSHTKIKDNDGSEHHCSELER